MVLLGLKRSYGTTPELQGKVKIILEKSYLTYSLALILSKYWNNDSNMNLTRKPELTIWSSNLQELQK